VEGITLGPRRENGSIAMGRDKRGGGGEGEGNAGGAEKGEGE